MKTQIITIALSFISLIMFQSCKGESETTEVNLHNEVYEKIQNVEISKASNPANPYDYFGVQHFNGVNALLKDFQVYPTIPEILEKSATIFCETKSENYENILTEEQIRQIYNDAINKFSFCSDLELSQELRDELTTLSKVINDICENPEEYSYEYLKSQIIDYEATVIENHNLTEKTKEVILSSTSTVRHSALQWEDVIFDPNFNGPEPNGATVGIKKLKWWQWLVVAAADAGGAALGIIITPTGGVAAAVCASSATIEIFKRTN